jgi:hypothetical protein
MIGTTHGGSFRRSISGQVRVCRQSQSRKAPGLDSLRPPFTGTEAVIE